MSWKEIEVIGQMELRKMVNDRQEFASKVQDNSSWSG